MALLAYQQVQITGPAITYSAVNASDTVNPDDRGFIHVKNANAGACTATVVVPGTKFGQPLADVAVTVPASTGERMIGPLGPELADPTTGLVTITFSPTASVTSAAVRI